MKGKVSDLHGSNLHATLVSAKEILAIWTFVCDRIQRVDAARDTCTCPKSGRTLNQVLRSTYLHVIIPKSVDAYPTTHRIPAKIHAMGPGSESVLKYQILKVESSVQNFTYGHTWNEYDFDNEDMSC